jgi:hypothetical protein
MTLNEVTPHGGAAHQHTWRTLIEFTLPREPGGERLAVERVAEAVQRLNWPAAPLGRLKVALAKATRDAMERGHFHGSVGLLIVRVLIPESGGETAQEADPASDEPGQAQLSERAAQQIGRPPSRGWGFFLIEKARPDSGRAGRHLIELFLYPEGERPGGQRC